MSISSQTEARAKDADAVSNAAPKAVPEKHWVSDGERKFDRLTYRDIGYGVNVVSSIGAVWWAERTKQGQKALEGLGNLFAKIPSLTPERAKFYANKSFFLTGGFLVLVPMKLLENSKNELIKKWNRETYGDAVDTDPALIRSQQEVEEAHKQSWTSIFGSRVLSVAVFYATVGQLWDRTSRLAKWTNPDLRVMSAEAIKTMEKTKPAEFSQLASKGIYFDRPVGAVSRFLGKTAARITGNKQAIAEIETAQKSFPGTIQGSISTTPRDPIHSAMPYYVISEAITSAVTSCGVYVFTRLLGPIFGYKPPRKHTTAETPPSIQVTPAPASEAVLLPAEAANDPSYHQPRARLQASQLQHAPLQAATMQRAVNA